jgi:methionyl-tRNA synthetase
MARRAIRTCPNCGTTVSQFAAGCAVCGTTLPPYETRHRVTVFDDLKAWVGRALKRKPRPPR